ncbi:mTERF family protein [Musa troglodytarum]|uniref:mTERF family protein n=1 Tax=Musa troglodytarum TaxID=320322 RepID=A0A9E7IJV5_9LILI|nr:mTERF family protein [Musa troglodytarum]URE49644.1 mTERF family protein [Musa troglodytarum]
MTKWLRWNLKDQLQWVDQESPAIGAAAAAAALFCTTMAAAALRSVLRRNSLLPLFETRRLRDLVFFSSSVDPATAVGGTTSPDPHFMVEYLVNSCGFSPSEAAKFSKPIAHLRSTEIPDAVLNFMRSQGFDGAAIRKVISLKPNCLCYNVETNLAPKFQFLRNFGLSESDIVDAILVNYVILRLDVHRSFVPRLEMWERLLGSRELVRKHLKKTGWFFFSSVEKTLHPNLKFLRDECGIPEERLSLVLRGRPHFMSQKPESLRALVVRADELGMPRQSWRFVRILYVLHTVSKERFEAKVELMRSFGWSESEFSSAARKAPTFLAMSLDMVRRKMEFFINVVGYDPSFIASQPNLLLFSLRRRVIPRFRVTEMLKSKGLCTRQRKLAGILFLSDTKFMEKFVLLHKENVPELLDILRVAGTSYGGIPRELLWVLLLRALFCPTMAAATLRSVLRRKSLLPLFETCRLRDILFFSSSVDAAAAVGGTISPNPHFMVEYLVNSCGFSPSEAAKSSKPLAHLRSTEKPDAVLNFMRSQGFVGAGIRKLISFRPVYLCCNVENNLAPKFQFLRDLGLSESDIVDAILKNNGILRLNVRSIVPKLEMWESLLGSRELVLKHLKKTGRVENTLHPNLKFLRDECGIPEERVSLFLRSDPRFISRKPTSFRALVARADELGIPRQSRMFVWTLDVLHKVSKERFEAKIELMRSFGWSESEFSSAVGKAPTFLSMSLDMVRKKMEFFINVVGCTPSFIASQPNLLIFSLQKRVIPRFRVTEMLKLKGLWTRRCKFVWILCFSDTKFMEKKTPTFLWISLDMMRRKVEFFIYVVGYTPSLIADKSDLLLYSLQKRVIPRFRVTEMLKLKGLWTGQAKFSYILSITDTKFIEQFVLPHKENVPELLDILRAGAEP